MHATATDVVGEQWHLGPKVLLRACIHLLS